MMELISALVLVITNNASQAERVRGILTVARYRVLRVSDFETAEARIAGGGVDLVVVPFSPGQTPVWESIVTLQKRAAGLPVVVLSDGDSGSGELLAAHGASGSGMLQVVQEAGLLPTAHTLIERRQVVPQPSGRDFSAGNISAGNFSATNISATNTSAANTSAANIAAGIISLQGAKGGVGASTVALNLATVLAGKGKTILAEMRPGLGTLASRFRLRRKVRTIADLAATPADRVTAADLESCLWPCPEIPGLSILFGSAALDGGLDWAARVTQTLRLAAETADYVLADLPHCFSSVNRGALRATDYFLLVLERDALCLDAGKLMLRAMEAENLLPHSAAAVVVSRVSLAAPVDLSEVEHELNVPILGSVPPDPDLCIRAYRAQTAVVALDPESILSASYAHLAEALPATLRVRRAQHA